MQQQRRTILARFLLVTSLGTSASVSAQGLGGIVGIPVGSLSQSVSGGAGASTAVKATTGFAIGLSAESGGLLGIGANVLYAQRNLGYAPYLETQTRSYVDVPVYLKVTLPARSVSPFVFVGPQGSQQVGCTNCGPVTFAAVAGVGLKFGALHSGSLQARYIYGFTDENTRLGTNPGGFFEPPSTFRVRSLLLLAGIGF